MKKDNDLPDRNNIINYLFHVKSSLREKFGSELSGFYVYGSLINDLGRGFNPQFSDIDLLTTTSLTGAHERTDFLVKLREAMQSIEEDVKIRLKKRSIFPVISLCVVTQFELEEGIHKNRNAANAFANYAFHPLESVEDTTNISIGRMLKEDLVGIHFPAWAVLSEVQEVRSIFVTPKASIKEKEKEEKGFKHQFLPLPKELLRNAYVFHCYKANEDQEMIVEDDIAKGLTVVKTMLGEVRKTDDFANDLLKLIETNTPGGKNPGSAISLAQLFYLWELLSSETEKALLERRRGLDSKTLTFAAPAVILELSRLRKTSLEAVDMSISLYRNEYFVQHGILPVEIVPHQKIEQYEFSKFDRAKVISLAKEWPKDIRDYIVNQLEVNECDNCQSKVGFSGIVYSHTGMAAEIGIPRQAYLRVRPLNYWILQQFNLAMAADPGNQKLRQFREKYGCELFKSIQDYHCSCPSGLYLEVVIVTKDGDVIIIPKLAAHSPLSQGRGSSILTCGFEHGFTWRTNIIVKNDKSYLNVEQAVMDGLEKEFLVNPEEVQSWNVSTLAIHHAHLNAAILGVVHLKLSNGELLDRFSNESKHFSHKEIKFFTRDAAKDAMRKDKGSGKWHQTALMRINLIR